MAIKGTEEVFVMRPGKPDRYGDASGEPALLALLKRCVVWPRGSTEVAVEGNVITEGYNVWVPHGPNRAQLALIEAMAEPDAITGDDRIMVRGKEWQIVGNPADHRSMRGRELGLQMIVGRVA